RSKVGRLLNRGPDREIRSMQRGTSLRLAACLAATLFAIVPGRSDATPTSAPHIQVELVAESESARPGSALWVGLRMVLEKGWHVYWRNPGDSGLPPSLKWDLPAGVSAGPIEWPTPERIAFGPLVNYGYEGEVLLPAKLDIAEGVPLDKPLRLAAR